MSLGPNEVAASSPDRDDGWGFSQPVEGLSEHTIQLLLYHFWQLVQTFWPVFQKSKIPDSSTSGIYQFVPALAVNSMLLAAAGQFEGIPAEDQAVLDNLLWTTEREVLIAAIDAPSIATCQALLLLSIKSHRTGKHTKSWHFLGLACRVMQSLGSHRDRASEHGVEIHRRLFWTCYILDKLLGVELGRPWMIRRSDSNAKLVSETEVEEFEHISMMFPSETAPAAGRVLSTFNAQCRLAVLYEKVMDCRQTFASSEARAAAISTINRICERWREMLPAHLQIGPQVCQQPVMVYALHALYFSCVALLHLSSATDALKDGKADSYHVRRLSDTSAAWTRMIYEAPHHFIYSVQCARPLSFPPLLLATINNLVATPAMLSSNQGCLQALSRHRDGGKAFDSRASLLHVIKSISSLIPTEPTLVFGGDDDPFHRSPPYLELDPWMDHEVEHSRPLPTHHPSVVAWNAWKGFGATFEDQSLHQHQ